MNYVYSDGSGEIGSACRQLGIPHEKSEAGDASNNAIAERQIQEAKLGVATYLAQSGLPHPYWLYAMKYHSVAANIRPRRLRHADRGGHSLSAASSDDHTPWFLRFGENFGGALMPFGTANLFIPTTISKE